MSPNFRVFADELTKIAIVGRLGGVAKQLGQGAKTVLREGWTGDVAGQPASSKNWRRVNQGMTLLGGGMMLRDAMQKQDPSGMGRSQGERLSSGVGSTLGSMAGTSLMYRLMPKNPLIAGMVGGIGGGMVGEKLTTSPWKKRRAQEIAQQRAQLHSQLQYGAPPEASFVGGNR